MRVIAVAMMTAGMLAAGGVTAALATTTTPVKPVACAPGAVTLVEGDMITDGGKYFEEVRLVLTNGFTTPCFVDAHPEATLTGPEGDTLAVPQLGEQLKLTLSAGESAHTSVRVRVVPDATDTWEPGSLRLALGAAGAADLTWPEGLAIVKQNAAIGPITRGA
jgi:hypothetical protein